MSFSQTLLPEFDEEMKNTRKMLECVPDGKFDYQPHPKSMSIPRDWPLMWRSCPVGRR